MQFYRSKENQIVTYYEHFIMNYDWTMAGVPHGIGEWYLLVALGEGIVDYPLRLKAIYVDQIDDDQPKYIFVEATDDKVMKMIVTEDINEILNQLPTVELKAVNALQGGSVIVHSAH